MSDIAVTIKKDGTSVMIPQTDKGREMLPQEIVFDQQKTAFFLPPNLTHFEASGLKVDLKDER